jgi:hypothetical protein
MYYGQANIDPATVDTEAVADHRGIVPPDIAAKIRRIRIAEEWVRTDTICIGQGASRVNGWAENWQQFAASDNHEWFGGRLGGPGKSFSNQSAERNDFAQDIRYFMCEFVAPPGIGDIETYGPDGLTMPQIFTQQLPTMLHISVVMSDTDEILSLPASQMTTGNAGAYIDGSAAPSMMTKLNGGNNARTGFFWPVPVMVAAKSRITFQGRIDRPIRDTLAALPNSPGSKQIPDGAGGVAILPA